LPTRNGRNSGVAKFFSISASIKTGEIAMSMTCVPKNADEILDAIARLDLEPIKFKLMNPDEGEGWSREEVNSYEREYKRFLILLTKYPDVTIAPNKEVDRFWHAHILDTRKYAEDCDKVFGYFLHHFPYFGMRGEKDAAQLAQAFKAMQALREQEFGNEEAAYPNALAVARTGAAYCGVMSTKGKEEAAYCGVASAQQEKAAYCGVMSTKGKEEAAYCGVMATLGAEGHAYCGALRPTSPSPVA
jgi:hypothetical protein